MIPKQMFFVYVGKEMPNWAINSYYAFCSINPDFNPNVIHIKDFDPNIGEGSFPFPSYEGHRFEINESSIVDLPKIIINTYFKASLKGTFLNWKYKQDLKIGITNKACILSDLIRFELLYQYGGIYIDCDTFPNRPFDDKLLKKKQFFASTYHGGIRIVRDNYILGSEAGRYIDFSYNRIFDMLRPISYPYKNVKLKEKFFNGDCGPKDIDPSRKGYIEHFFNRNWK